EFRQFVDSETQAGRAVAVHCSSGRRRTATFLAAYLILNGMAYQQAIQAVALANPVVEMRATQLQFLKTLTTQAL
ncbi:protein-tyrosine phosphatase family protein, partial [Haemophilus parainfluenzae]|uniref:protein-tyrosine phosphatase family protein n=1 Tax=Haemophilus parainfluenzae TaxID=729 RepID=UPI00157EE511